jgi:predicted homoserine dehydrogenase-like protein
MRGIVNSVICDIQADAAVRAFTMNGVRKQDIIITDKSSMANDGIRHSIPVVIESFDIVSGLDVDCVVEGTGIPEIGAEVAFLCIQGGKNVVLLNVETDVAVGSVLHTMAEQAGVIYTVSSGDEPGLLTELVDRYGGLGFEVVAVGKSPVSLAKMDRHATPETVAEDGKILDLNPEILVTFRDGTKTSIEMSSISNATGLVPDVVGMHGPIAGIQDLANIFRLKNEGGILNKRGVVDYARPLMNEDGSVDFVHSVTPGVFLVLRTEHPQLKLDLEYWNVIHEGDYFTFYTPYHLASNELPLSIVWAVEDHEPTVIPRYGPITEVIGAAKRNIKTGAIVKNTYMMYGLNDTAVHAKEKGCVPFALLEGAKVVKDIEKDTTITWDMVDPRQDTVLYNLRKLQDRLFS